MHLAVFVPTNSKVRWEEWKRGESNLRNKWRNFGAKNMSKGSVWKTRYVGFKSLPSWIYSRRCWMQHHSLCPRSQFTKRSDGFAKFPQRKPGHTCWHILSSYIYLVRSYYANVCHHFDKLVDTKKVWWRLLLPATRRRIEMPFLRGEWRDRW